MATPIPDMALEERLLDEGATLVAGIDEVGRGAWAGPVTVGVVVIDTSSELPPRGLRDSKALSAAARQRLAPEVVRWARDSAVGHASPEECDELGMRSAIALASSRAMESLSVRPDAVIVDGPVDLLAADDLLFASKVAAHGWRATPPTRTEAIIKADQTCASVAAASVVAKGARDALMAALAPSFPAFDLDSNVGYPSAAHQRALRGYGLTSIHRRSWSFTEGIPWLVGALRDGRGGRIP